MRRIARVKKKTTYKSIKIFNLNVFYASLLLFDKTAPMEHTFTVKRMITIIEFSSFLAQIGKCMSVKERDEFIDYLAKNPAAGEEITGTGGVRKIRWSGNGKGKRGGVRVIYYYYNETAPVFLLTVYGKGEKEDLSSEQKKQIAALAKILKAECKSMRRHHHD